VKLSNYFQVLVAWLILLLCFSLIGGCIYAVVIRLGDLPDSFLIFFLGLVLASFFLAWSSIILFVNLWFIYLKYVVKVNDPCSIERILRRNMAIYLFEAQYCEARKKFYGTSNA